MSFWLASPVTSSASNSRSRANGRERGLHIAISGRARSSRLGPRLAPQKFAGDHGWPAVNFWAANQWIK